jgi:P pilus assembly chaperone PapD
MSINSFFSKKTKFLWIGLLSGIFFSLPVMAQQFSVAPMVTIVSTQGNSSKSSINVVNKGKEPLRVRVYAESFTYDSKKGFVFTQSDERSAVPYLQFSPREMEIPPGVTRNVRVSVTLPASLPDREYRAAVFIEDLKELVVLVSYLSRLVLPLYFSSVKVQQMLM